MEPTKTPSVLVAVSTSARPRSYLLDTLASLEQAGAGDFTKVVFSDGPFPSNLARPCSWPRIVTHNPIKSPRNNLQAAIRMAVKTDVDRLLFFEDDIVACRGAVSLMASISIPNDASFVSFHDMKEIQQGSRPTFIKVPIRGFDGRGFWGLQAVVFPKRTLKFLAEKDFFSVLRETPHSDSDRTLEELLSVLPNASFYVHVPSIVQHVGHVSLARPGNTLHKRQTRNWPGEDFDAVVLGRAYESRKSDLIAVMTSPRRGASYLDETLRRLDLEGAGHEDVQKVVFSDGPISTKKWPTFEYPGPTSLKNALWRVFRHVSVLKPRRLILVEDDVLPCKNAVTKVLGTEIPAGAPFLSFFDYRSVQPSKPHGFYSLTSESNKGGRYWGFQAVVFPFEVVSFLANLDLNSVATEGSDTLVWELLRDSPWQHTALHVPSLFDHVGEISTWGNSAFHRALNFPGEDFDALSLPTYDLCSMVRLDMTL